MVTIILFLLFTGGFMAGSAVTLFVVRNKRSTIRHWTDHLDVDWAKHAATDPLVHSGDVELARHVEAARAQAEAKLAARLRDLP